MNTKKFSEAMGELDTEYVEKAMNYQAKKKKNVWFKLGVMAACLCLVIASVIVLSQQNILVPGDISTHGTGGEGGVDGGNEGVMYSVAVYPATESNENVASADVISLSENEVLNNSLAEHLPKQLPDGFHYGRGSLYSTIMKDGTQYNMLRIEYISGEIPEQHFTEDGGAIAPDVDVVGEVFIVCVMNYEPDTNSNIYSSTEEVTLSLLEESRGISIRIEDCYVSVFIDTAEPTAVLDALRNID